MATELSGPWRANEQGARDQLKAGTRQMVTLQKVSAADELM
jgi:hypothetical protein